MRPEAGSAISRCRLMPLVVMFGGAMLAMAPRVTGADARRLTLEEALALAEKAPLARAATLEVERVRAEGRGAGLWPNPNLQFDREAAGEEVERIAALSVSLPLSGRLGLERSAARTAVTAAERRARQGRIERRSRVREAFLELLAAQERDQALEAAVGRVDGLVRVVRARAAEGESSGYDRMRSEQERADVIAQRLEARAALGGACAVLGSLIGVSPSDTLAAEGTLEGVRPRPDPQEERSTVAGRGDVEALAAEAEQRDLLARAATRSAVPEPALVLGRKTLCAGANCDSGATLGFALTLPLFDRSQGTRAALRVDAALARARREALLLQAQAEADAAFAEAEASRQAEAAFAEAPLAERILAIAQAAYEAGEMRVFELLDAYRTALATSLRRIELRLSARRAEVRLERAVGIERAP